MTINQKAQLAKQKAESNAQTIKQTSSNTTKNIKSYMDSKVSLSLSGGFAAE